MAKRAETFSSLVQQVHFIGRTTGLVKTLSGFKKSHHSVPDAVNTATSAFLAKLAAQELADEAENLFQRARTTLAYKRKDIALHVASPQAVLTARDFTCELAYALDEHDPASFILTRTLHSLRSADFAATPECDTLFAGQFSELSFLLTRGATVEAVIDAVEAIDGETGLTVNYPSDCSRCVLSVSGVAAEVRFEGSELAMQFPQRAAPNDLLQAFAAVRDAFSLSRQAVLAGLLQPT